MTIRTVTLSPGFDHVVLIDHANPGTVGRVLEWTTFASGKGVNVARIAFALRSNATVYSLVGEDDQSEFVGLIELSGARAVTVAVPGSIRNNLTLALATSTELASHAVGQPLLAADDGHADRLIEQLIADVQPSDIVTFNGAVPPRVRPGIWADAAVGVRARGATIIADVQGDSLIAVLATGFVSMAKPNEDEVGALVHGRGATLEERACEAVQVMLGMGVEDPVVTIGKAGVIHAEQGAYVRSWCAVDHARLAVAAGDAFLAGYSTASQAGVWGEVPPIHLGLATAAAHVAGTEADRFSQVVLRNLSAVRQERIGQRWCE